jgi:predicted methyltransferase
MRNLVILGVLVAALTLCMGASTKPSAGDAKAYAAAVADSSRPTTDSSRDADRKPAETLAFAHIKAGDKVADYAAGGGYFTRMFLDVVGPKGHVYAVEPDELQKYTAKATAELQTFATTHTNLTVSTGTAMGTLKFPEPLDVFWISQNYHDLKDKFFGPVDTAAFNKAVYAALKPGGIYIVLDHAAVAGAPSDVTESLHRIDPAVVRSEVEAAGFKFESESKTLANPSDPHTVAVFDKSIRGKTDQFIYKFRKPK